MAFIVGSILGAGASIVGGAIASSGAKKAAKTAAAGSEREIEFNRESRDLARADQAPYREAGYTALDALMSMTGLKGTGKAISSAPKGPLADAPAGFNAGSRRFLGNRQSGYAPIHARYAGGSTEPETMYNVSEMAPENVYAGGRVRRYPGPVTIDGETGYVEPNIEGRNEGGIIGGMYDRKITPPWGEPRRGPPKYPNQNVPNPAIASGGVRENPGGVEGGYNFMTDPGYGFRYDEGMRALETGAAARGGLLSGGFAKKAIRYGQGMASDEYSNVYNRIASIAGIGQTAGTTSGNAALMAGANMGTAAAQGGYARASGYQAAGNAWANAGNQIAQLPWGNVFNQGNST